MIMININFTVTITFQYAAKKLSGYYLGTISLFVLHQPNISKYFVHILKADIVCFQKQIKSCDLLEISQRYSPFILKTQNIRTVF